MRIREARPDEHVAVGALTVSGYASAPYFRVEGNPYVDELRDVAGRAAQGTVLVAVDDDQPGEPLRGTATYVAGPGPHAEFDDPSGGGIRMVAVAPDAQGRGIGTALGRACLDLAVADDRDPVVLHTVDGYEATARLWRRLGFRPDPARDWSPEAGIRLRGWTWRHPDRLAATPWRVRGASPDQAGGPPLPDGLHLELVPAIDPRAGRLVDALAHELAGRYGRAAATLGAPEPAAGDDVWLVTRDARPVATGTLRPGEAAGELIGWVVDVGWRGRGIGRRLLVQAAEQAAARGLRRLDLVVGDRQPEAVALVASECASRTGLLAAPTWAAVGAGSGSRRLSTGVAPTRRPLPWAP